MGMLEGKVVAVTGAGRGVGREIALLCAKHGAAVVVNDPGVGGGGEGGDAGPAQETVNDIVAAGGKAHANLASVADPVGAASIIEDAVQRFGRIDAVVNNAGILRDTIWHKMSHEDWRAVIDVHLNGTFNVSKAATPYFREQQSGSFIHFTSTSGLIGNLGQANYSAAKAGDIGFVKALAQEGAAKGITVNAICPGYIGTEMVRAIAQDVLEKRILPLIPVGRLGEPEEIARAVVFLASDDAGFITGSTISANGGQYMS